MFIEIIFAVQGSEHVRRSHFIDLADVVSINVRTFNPRFASVPPQIIFNFSGGHSEKFEGLSTEAMDSIVANWRAVRSRLANNLSVDFVPDKVFTAGWIEG